MRLVWSFIFGAACVAISLTILFQVIGVNDIVRYCEFNNLMLIDDMCTEELLEYGMNMFVAGIWLGVAGVVLIASVLVAPALSTFGRGEEGMKV